MNELKPFASLSSSLLARKGQARPAMRPQLIALNSTLEDLGWNDMGSDPELVVEEAPAPIYADNTDDVEQNPVVRAQENIVDAFAQMPSLTARMIRKPGTALRNLGKTPVLHANAGAKGKVAFTLRLDGERHLKLRIASAMSHRSAQQIVTEALDQYLATLPEIDVSAWTSKTPN